MNALLFILRFIGITIVDADPSSETAFETGGHDIPENNFVHSELAKAREDGYGCIVINTESGLDFLKFGDFIGAKGEEQCSNSLRLS